MDQIQFMKGVQIRTTYLSLLLYFGISALFRFGGEIPPRLACTAKITIFIAGVLGALYHIHTFIELIKRRKKEEIAKQIPLALIYTILHIMLIVLGGTIALMAIT